MTTQTDNSIPYGSALLSHVTALKMQQLPEQLAHWYDSDAIRANVIEALIQDVERVTSDDLAAQFASHCPVRGVTDSAAFKNRFTSVGILGDALTGIRFKGLDLEQPFVSVVVTASLPVELSGISELARYLKAEYQSFKPRHLRLFIPSQSALSQIPDGKGFEWEQRFLAAPIRQLRQKSPISQQHVRVGLAADLSFYETYAREYVELHTRYPEHLQYARAESEEDMQDYLEEATLFTVHIDDRWAGVIAVTPQTEQGLRGYLVVEMFLSAEFRGRGYGPLMQRHLVDQLPAQDDDVLYGTIHKSNLPAVRAARHAGREDIGGYLWVTLE